MNLTLIINAEVYSPEPLGCQQVLVGGTRVLAIAPQLDVSGELLEVVDAAGQWLMPGFVDSLTHPCGGGGEGGFGNRTAEVDAATFIRAGVTSPVGALGTDSITRSLNVLFGKTMALRADGLDAYMYTGAYRVPAPTLTGDIARDITLIEPVIGVGEVAISDHRSSQPSTEELRRLAADTGLGGILKGHGGTVMLHLGDGDSRLTPLRNALQNSDLPLQRFYPTHCNRSPALLAEAVDFARDGGFVDITASTTPELITMGDIPPLQALENALASGAPASQLTLSSDAGGSLPVYEDGQLRGLTAASPAVLLEVLQTAMRETPELVPAVIAALTRNPAAALGLPDKGRLRADAGADLLLVNAVSGELAGVMCKGQWLLREGEMC